MVCHWCHEKIDPNDPYSEPMIIVGKWFFHNLPRSCFRDWGQRLTYLLEEEKEKEEDDG